MTPLGIAKFWHEFDQLIKFANENFRELTGKMRKPSLDIFGRRRSTERPPTDSTIYNDSLRHQFNHRHQSRRHEDWQELETKQ